MRFSLLFVLAVCHVLLTSNSVFAQNTSGPRPEKDWGWEFGAQLSTVLPNKVDGVEEIFYTSGARIGGEIGASEMAFWEGVISTGDDEGVKWSQGSLGARIGLPIDSLLAIVFLGIDGTQYEASGVENKFHIGTHFGGGFMTEIAGGIWFRTDMKMVFTPGSTMHINFGIVYRIPRSGGGGN
jgi:hypothetical protein